jgi:hypothetical protein
MSSPFRTPSMELVLYSRQSAHCWRHEIVRAARQSELVQTYLHVVPSLRYSSSSSSSDAGLPRVRLVARDCAGDAAAEPVLEVAPEAMREAVLRETVLLLSRALLRRSRIVKYLYGDW